MVAAGDLDRTDATYRRSAGDRAELRASMVGLKLAELREGVWTRPANLARSLPDWPDDLLTTFRAVPDDDQRALAHRLFDLSDWNRTAQQLLVAVTSAS